MPTSRFRGSARHLRAGGLLVALGLLGVPACRHAEVRIYGPVDPPPGTACEVVEFHDIPYYRGEDSDPSRHRLDLYLPRGVKDYPVVLLVHGGAWMVGNNRCSGLYSSVGEFLASQGIAAVLPNYRLSPAVKHPEHVKDIARAFAWVRSHIARRGGRPDRIFVAGHSAGGHLVSLLATDEQYLAGEGLKIADVRGVISLGGVYDIPVGSLPFTFGGTMADAFNLNELMPFRGMWECGGRYLPAIPGIPMRVNVFGPAFGENARVREDASPCRHVREGLPPFLIFCAEKDLPTLTGMGEAFHEALRQKGCDAQLIKVPGRNHNSMLFRAVEAEDPVAKAILAFVWRHSG